MMKNLAVRIDQQTLVILRFALLLATLIITLLLPQFAGAGPGGGSM